MRRRLVFVAALVATGVCNGAENYDAGKPATDIVSGDMYLVEAAAMQQWFEHVQPQIKEWGKCGYALLSSDLYGPADALTINEKLRGNVQKVLPSVAPNAKAFNLSIEYTKWFHTWRGYHQGLAAGSGVSMKEIADAWANDCVKAYGAR